MSNVARNILPILLLATLWTATPALASGINQSYCISFEPSSSDLGFMLNSCSSSLDVTWCHSDSLSTCSQQWKSAGVDANGRSTVSLDREDRGKSFKLIHACERHSSKCLMDSVEYKEKHSR